MMHPSSESQERQNAYTDWLLRQHDEFERKAEESAESQREEMRYVPHTLRVGLLGSNFCEICGSNVKLHERIPYGEGRAQ
jgi:hypothetical protein